MKFGIGSGLCGALERSKRGHRLQNEYFQMLRSGEGLIVMQWEIALCLLVITTISPISKKTHCMVAMSAQIVLSL